MTYFQIQRKETKNDAPFKDKLGWYELENCTSRFPSRKEALNHYRKINPHHTYKIIKLALS